MTIFCASCHICKERPKNWQRIGGFFHNISTDIVNNFCPLFPILMVPSEPKRLHQIKKIVPLYGIRNKGKYEY